MQVFLSHTPDDRDLARGVASALREAGFEVWDPETEILPGDNWAEKIGQALEESEAMVVLLTPEALESESVRRDIDYALGNVRFRERLIPVLTRPFNELSERKLPWILKRLKSVNLTENDPSSMQRIAAVIREAA